MHGRHRLGGEAACIPPAAAAPAPAHPAPLRPAPPRRLLLSQPPCSALRAVHERQCAPCAPSIHFSIRESYGSQQRTTGARGLLCALHRQLGTSSQFTLQIIREARRAFSLGAGNWETLRFLLSNARWWMDEYKFDGYRCAVPCCSTAAGRRAPPGRWAGVYKREVGGGLLQLRYFSWA